MRRALVLRSASRACTTSTSSSVQDLEARAQALQPGLKSLRAALDDVVVAQSTAKHALMLGLVAREHVYLEGPPGCGKTALATGAAHASGMNPVKLWQLHRDVRAGDFFGDTIVRRERAFGADGNHKEAEILQQIPALNEGVSKAKLCVLDDINRAPGETMSILLRVLAERRDCRGNAFPLAAAFATGCPPGPDHYTAPLDFAILDRFALQVQMESIVAADLPGGGDGSEESKAFLDAARNWCMQQLSSFFPLEWSSNRNFRACVRTMRRNGSSSCGRSMPSNTAPDFEQLHRLLPLVDLGPIKMLLLEFLSQVRARCHERGPWPFLSDRAFLVQAPRILRAQALLSGRAHCLPEDLEVVEYITTFRVPADMKSDVKGILAEYAKQPKTLHIDDRRTLKSDTHADQLVGLTQDDASSKKNHKQEDLNESESNSRMQRLLGVLHELAQLLGLANVNLHPHSIANMDVILEALNGKFQESRIMREAQPGGVPRRWQQMTHFDLTDVDPTDVAMWCDSISPDMPRTWLRLGPRRGGALAIVRDVSHSMQGLHTKWGSSLALRLVELAEKRAMKIGYAEFHTLATLHLSSASRRGSGFFMQDYEGVRTLARSLSCQGQTNYQEVLQKVLAEYRVLGESAGQGRHVLLLTDGLPNEGCKHCTAEVDLAIQLGVCLHVVFIGGQAVYPSILERLATNTGGRQYQAVPDYSNGLICVYDRSR